MGVCFMAFARRSTLAQKLAQPVDVLPATSGGTTACVGAQVAHLAWRLVAVPTQLAWPRH
jgi:hypothetical protein